MYKFDIPVEPETGFVLLPIIIAKCVSAGHFILRPRFDFVEKAPWLLKRPGSRTLEG